MSTGLRRRSAPAVRPARGGGRSHRHRRRALLPHRQLRCDAAVPDEHGQRLGSLDVRLEHRRSHRRPHGIPTTPCSPTTPTTASTTARTRPAARPSCWSPSAGRTALWEPFSQRYEGLYRITRSLSKSVYGNKLIFEEVNHDLGLSFFCAWMTSDRFGFVRRAALVNLGAEAGRSRSSGWHPEPACPTASRAGSRWNTARWRTATRRTNSSPKPAWAFSSSVPFQPTGPSPTRRCARPRSGRRASNPRAGCCARRSSTASGAGRAVEEETLIRGRRGAYFVNTRLALPAGGRKEWSMVAEVDQDAASVAALGQPPQVGGEPARAA